MTKEDELLVEEILRQVESGEWLAKKKADIARKQASFDDKPTPDELMFLMLT